jgi:transcriptional regulator with XRE-family HTH domain
MHRPELHSRLRRERRKWGLTQEDMAHLLSICSASEISRVENGWKKLGVPHVVAASLLFNRPINDLFPTIHRQVRDELLSRAFALLRQVEHDKRPEAHRKRQLLQEFLARISS